MFGLTVDGAACADPGAGEDSAPVDGEGLGVGALMTGGSGSPFDPGNACPVGLSFGAEVEGIAGAGPVVGPDFTLAGGALGGGLMSVADGVGPVVGADLAPGDGETIGVGVLVTGGNGAVGSDFAPAGGAPGARLVSVVEGVAGDDPGPGEDFAPGDGDALGVVVGVGVGPGSGSG